MFQISYFNNRNKNITILVKVAKRMLIHNNCSYVCGGGGHMARRPEGIIGEQNERTECVYDTKLR